IEEFREVPSLSKGTQTERRREIPLSPTYFKTPSRGFKISDIKRGFELKRGWEKPLGSFSRDGGTGTERFQNEASLESSGVGDSSIAHKLIE
ncbi:MAG: hypothetical protein PHP35_01995, partial [Candidatus Colwellbacteria bacterium]|nr:hypothetical protein [Candidatus Colwellbacteria bacterium]